MFEHRSGDVPRLDVRADGSRVLYDTAGVLQVLSLPSGAVQSVLQAESGCLRPFAVFSPSGQQVVTAEARDGPLRLWQVPDAGRARDVCQLAAPGLGAACAAFSGDGSAILVGTRDRQILVWGVPPPAELERVIPGQLTRIDHAVGPGGKQVRVWAEFVNRDSAVIPGTTAAIVVPTGRR
jgi:WD40 repeat protein